MPRFLHYLEERAAQLESGGDAKVDVVTARGGGGLQLRVRPAVVLVEEEQTPAAKRQAAAHW